MMPHPGGKGTSCVKSQVNTVFCYTQGSMKFFRGVCLLLALGSSTARGDGGSTCSPGGVTELRDTLRQSACRLRGNRTEGDIFRAHVQAKHGVGASELHNSVVFMARSARIMPP